MTEGDFSNILSLDPDTVESLNNLSFDEPEQPVVQENINDDAEAPKKSSQDTNFGILTIPWRVALSLNTLLGQINMLAPNRSKASDGSIGDASHAERNSDHNPWVVDANGQHVVTARDFTHDVNGGLDAGVLAEVLRITKDPRVKYVIWNRHFFSSSPDEQHNIPNWTWIPYNGANPHDKHMHISVMARQDLYDNRNLWRLPNRLRR